MADNETDQNPNPPEPAKEESQENKGKSPAAKDLGPPNPEPYSDRASLPKFPTHDTMKQPQNESYRPSPMMMAGLGEPDCCLCFPLNCGVKTLFFLTAVGLTVLLVNIIAMMVNKQWYVLIQLLVIPPMVYTLYYVYKYDQKDTYQHRFRISEGFKYQFIISLLVNLILFIVVLTSLEDFFEHEDTIYQINQGTPAYGYNYAYYNDGNRYQSYQTGRYSPDLYGTPGSFAYQNDPAYRKYVDNQQKLNIEKVSTETIAWYAVLYGAFILIYGLLGFYWWTVVRRWADNYLNNVNTLEDLSAARGPGNNKSHRESMRESQRHSYRKSNRV